MKNLMMGLLLLAVAGTASAQGNSRNAAGVILGDNHGTYDTRGNDGYDRNRDDRDRYDHDRYDRDHDRRDDKYDRDYREGSYNATARERYQREVQAVNRNFDERADRVRRDNRLRARERRDALVAIERDRQQRLRELNDRYTAYNRGSSNYRGY